MKNTPMDLRALSSGFIGFEGMKTPYLAIDRGMISERYRLLSRCLPTVNVYYSVKANPDARILKYLGELGASFEAASLDEIRACIRAGANPASIHFGNPIKIRQEIRRAYRLGVRSYSFDSMSELEKLCEEAPGSMVIARLATDGRGAVWGLTRKYGTDVATATGLLIEAHRRGMDACGVSFHVGSQQSSPDAWRVALEMAGEVFDALLKEDISPSVVNLGGGLPATGYHINGGVEEYDYAHYLGELAQQVDDFARRFDRPFKFIIEPGRFLVANAGMVVARVLMDAWRKAPEGLQRWLYLDVGKFNGLYEASDIQLPFYCVREGCRIEPSAGPGTVRTVLAGPTCDSDDMLLPKGSDVLLDSSIGEGSFVVFPAAGAYSTSYATMSFNGFKPMDVHWIDDLNPTKLLNSQQSQLSVEPLLSIEAPESVEAGKLVVA
ncbi:type III PLP-dependent enzyme [Roseateles sp. DB2]|uniref:type III PLP-dependent enzyme n=1 Tax=Roseateles sp. DB2 TaxID=3453717 RepID=UPI003EEAD638